MYLRLGRRSKNTSRVLLLFNLLRIGGGGISVQLGTCWKVPIIFIKERVPIKMVGGTFRGKVKGNKR